MTPTELKQHRVLVVGLGVSGVSVARYLEREHVPFDVADERSLRDLDLPSASVVHQGFDVASDYDVVILSPGIPRAHQAIARAIGAGVTVIGDVELFASVVDKPVIAVTGSNGKSTVVAWLTHALEQSGVQAIACGNIGLGVLDALDAEASVYVLELSSYQLESLTRLKPLAAAVLNVSEDHLDRYVSLDEYAAVKRQIYSGALCRVVNALDAQTLPDAALTSRDGIVVADAHANAASGDTQAVCWHFSTSAGRIAANDEPAVELCRSGVVLLDASQLSVPGIHNAANALTVLALAECLTQQSNITIDHERFIHAVQDWAGLPHRTALVVEHDGVRWYDDSKGTNVDACIKAIEAMSGKVVLIAGGIGKGADFSVLEPVVKQHVKQAILIGRDSAAIAQALDGATQLTTADSLQQAVALADAAAEPGDAVLLSPACSSFDMFENYMARGLAFQSAVAAQVGAR